jgi:hypothetical protein
MLTTQGHELEELLLEDKELRGSIAGYKWMVEEAQKMTETLK